MGRCNNRRVQQAAEAMKNTPARARFSSGPPNKPIGRGGGGRESSSTRGGRGSGRGGGGRRDDSANQGNGGRGRGQRQQIPANNKASFQIVSKMAQRLKHQRSTTSTTCAHRADPLKGVVVYKLDEIQLSEEAISAIGKILAQLEIVSTAEHYPSLKSTTPQQEYDDDDGSGDSKNESSEPVDKEIERTEGGGGDDYDIGASYGDYDTGGYEEYENDFDEFSCRDTAVNGNQSMVNARMPEVIYSSPDTNPPTEEQSTTPRSVDNDYDDGDHHSMQKDPVFLHLTNALSFSADAAAKACRAIVNWGGTGNNSSSKQSCCEEPEESTISAASKDHATRMSIAMDWLCLHLPEEDLENGFLPNPLHSHCSDEWNSSALLLGLTPATATTKIKFKAIPHKSISLATKLTEDLEWQRSERLSKRAVGFVKLGFHFNDALAACEQHGLSSCSTDLQSLQDWVILRHLLCALETEVSTAKGSFEEVDNETAKDAKLEQEQELEALSAIYEGNVCWYTTNTTYEETCVEIKVQAESTNGTGVDNFDQNSLYVLMRQGYPLKAFPLMLFFNPHMPAPLLRRINVALIQQTAAVTMQGHPVIFDLVTYLAEHLRSIERDFREEQALVEAGEIDDNFLLENKQRAYNDLDEGKLGRRQKARLRGATKAYNYEESQLLLEKVRLRRQAERIELAQAQQANLRQTLADRVIREREEQQFQEELRRVSRAAMSKALNQGQTVEQAREAATRRELEFKKEHGILSDDLVTSSKPCRSTMVDPSGAAEGKEESGTGEAELLDRSTPTTRAFMERLRGMYSAAQRRGPFVLRAPPSLTDSAKDGESGKNPPPCPVPSRTGEFTSIMEDVIELQQNQPWLVADEARVPTKSELSSQAEPGSETTTPNASEIEVSKKLLADRERMLSSEQYRDKIKPQRERLPAFDMRDEIVETIRNNQVVVVSGATGSGKTTQVPQFVLDAMISTKHGAQANILITQPRRISAISVAERMAQERCEKCGQTIGYSIKLERKTSQKTRILLCTTGILLRRLMGDPDLAAVSHVFVDEVHQRDVQTDFCLIILRELLKRRRKLKLILMSATLDAKSFSDYFGGCAIVSIPGRTHPVQEFRLEDILKETGHEIEEDSDFAVKKADSSVHNRPSKTALRRLYYPKYSSKVIHSLSVADESVINYPLLAELIEHICLKKEEGAILVFMPGLMEITKAIDELRKKEFFQSPSVLILPLHSSLSSGEQTAVFDVPPPGVRKIIISTNLAETSITVEDIVYVVDSGRVKENQRDELSGTPMLLESWVSRASANQRRGRAGRVRPGIAYHMFSSHTHDNCLKEYQVPEMRRVGLEDLILQILVLDLGCPVGFLARALDPPGASSLRNSLKLLEELGAVDCTWGNLVAEEAGPADCSTLSVAIELTPLGFHLASLPLDPRAAKILIFGAMFGCVESALTIAASMSSKSPFVSKFDQRETADEAKRELAIEGSDHIAVLVAFNRWKSARGEREASQFLKEYCLSRSTLSQMNDLRKQYADLLVDIGFLPDGFSLNQQDKKQGSELDRVTIAMLTGVLCAGLYPNVIVAPRSLVDNPGNGTAGEAPFKSLKGDVFLHPSTALFTSKRLAGRYCCYHEIIQTSKLYVRDCTIVNPLSLLLFGGALRVFQKQEVATVDGWLRFKVSRKSATSLKFLRSEMESILLRRIISPEDNSARERDTVAMMECIRIVLRGEDKAPKIATRIPPKEKQKDNSSSGYRRGKGRGQSETPSKGTNIVKKEMKERSFGRGKSGRGRGRGRTQGLSE